LGFEIFRTPPHPPPPKNTLNHLQHFQAITSLLCIPCVNMFNAISSSTPDPRVQPQISSTVCVFMHIFSYLRTYSNMLRGESHSHMCIRFTSLYEHTIQHL
jgi:hypothetical protein